MAEKNEATGFETIDFKAYWERDMKHKSKLQMGKKWLFYIYVSRIRSNLNNMALMRLKTAFQNFKTYSMPICVPALVEQPAAPEEHETEDPERVKVALKLQF